MAKLLIITQIYPSGATGTTVKTRNTINYLLEKGWEIDVCCIHHDKMVQNKFTAKNLRIWYVQAEVLIRFTPKHIARAFSLLFSLIPFRVKKLFNKNLQLFIEIAQESNEYKYILYDGFSTLQYAKQYSQRYIYIDDEDITDLMQQRLQSSKSIFLKLFYLVEYWKCRGYERKNLKFMNMIWAISPNTMKRLKTLTHKKMALMPTIVKQQRNIYTPQSQDIVFSGLLSWPENKNGLLWFFENHWPTILKHSPKTRIYITGQLADQNLQNYLKKQHNVLYLGYVSDLSEVYHACALAIAPILINAGIKVKILTYMSYGLPVVALSQTIGGIPNPKGIVETDESNFANAILETLQNKIRRKKLSLEAYRNMQNNHSKKTLHAFFQRVNL